MFREDFRDYNRQHHDRHFRLQDGDFRYILSGAPEKPAMIFLNGLDMQEMWLHYMKDFERDHRVLMIEYPISCTAVNDLLDGIAALLKHLHIEKPAVVGASDGGLLAQLYVRRFPENISALVLMTTVTLDSRYVADTNRENAALFLTAMKLVPYPLLRKTLLRRVCTYFNDESDAAQAYGRSFLEFIAANPGYMAKFIHAVKVLYDAGAKEQLRSAEFSSVRDHILILHPEKDIFIRADQEKLSALLAPAGAKVLYMKGGHLSFVSEPQGYIKAIREMMQ